MTTNNANRCERCTTTDPADRIIWRRLWNLTADKDGVAAVALCKDCNDIVQGPDHADITTENRA